MQVALECTGLDTGVRAVRALVGLGTRVSHLMPAERVVVTCAVFTQVASKGLLSCVLAEVHLE